MLSKENDQTKVSDSESKSLVNARVRFSAALQGHSSAPPWHLKAHDKNGYRELF